jgi:hypothetical protein
MNPNFLYKAMAALSGDMVSSTIFVNPFSLAISIQEGKKIRFA